MNSAQIDFPSWTPPSVKAMIQSLALEAESGEQFETLKRLATDQRMRSVWEYLKRKKRPTETYYNQAINTYGPGLCCDEIQSKALSRTIHFIYYSVRDKRRAVKIEEVEPIKQQRLAEAQTLRRVADELRSSVSNSFDPGLLSLANRDVDALQRVANWRESLAGSLADANDPNVIKNHHGDPLVRGVQIAVAAFFQDTFGTCLDGQAATLTNVALGTNAATARASRSAFSRQKPPQKSGVLLRQKM